MTTFVGRRLEVAEVRRRLSGSRLVTLTGAGGVGKTRLAAHVAAQVGPAFPDGVWLVELATVDGADPDAVAGTVAEALRVQVPASRLPLEAVADHVRDRRLLLILDNCEHLLAPCAALVDALLHASPGLKILVTSRQILGMTYEHTLAVPALGLPDGAGSRPTTRALSQCDAVRLFTDRAGAVLPGFHVTDGNRDAVEGICRRLDGIPLGIELAVARLRTLSPQQLLDRLDDPFRLLTTGSRAVLPRHRTLRALIDWSHALCTGRERLLWARASVFSGGFDLEAAEEVCQGDGLTRDEVLDAVTGLVDKSVLLGEESRSGVRYRLLETLRAYGGDRLAAAGQEAAVRRRHRDCYRRLAAKARTELFGPSQAACLTRLRLDHANLCTALDYSFTEPGEAETGLSLAADLLSHWVTGCHLADGRHWLDQGLSLCGGPTEVRARALWTDGRLAVLRSETAAAEAMLDESRRIGEHLGDASVLAHTALSCGMLAMSRGDTESAARFYEEAVAGHRADHDPAGLVFALTRLSLLHSFRRDPPQAVAAAEEARRICDAHGEGRDRAHATAALGIESWRQGDPRRAAALEKESLAVHGSFGDLPGIGAELDVLACIAAAEQHYERAARLLGALRTVRRASGVPPTADTGFAADHDACESRTSQALGPTAFRAAVKKGSRLPYDQVLCYALEDEPATAAAAPDGQEPSPLTPREAEIARLVAQGLSNKRIATALVIAQRTAEGHIEHILSKLGFTSRSQVAVWVLEHDRAAAGDEPWPEDTG